MVEYEKWIKNELKENKIRVHKWGEFNENEIYYAYFESRRVYIPRPKCSYSMLVALHEIGHLVKGNHIYGHIAEYEAEKWAINTALKRYNIQNEAFESVGKEYIYNNLLEDITFRLFPVNKIQKRILKWIDKTPDMIVEDVKLYCMEVGGNCQINVA